jgi:hypothetical protein
LAYVVGLEQGYSSVEAERLLGGEQIADSRDLLFGDGEGTEHASQIGFGEAHGREAEPRGPEVDGEGT